DTEKTFHSFNPRFNVTYRPGKDLMFYANAAKGFRSGFLNYQTEVFLAGLVGITGIEVVDPDSVWTYEVGAKTAFFDGSLFLDSTVFYSDWTDLQFEATTPLFTNFQVNAGDATIKGVEEALTWRMPISGLSTSLTASYNESEFKQVNAKISSFFPFAP